MEKQILERKKEFLKCLIQYHKSITEYDKKIKTNASITRDIQTNDEYISLTIDFKANLGIWEKALKNEQKRLKNMNTKKNVSKKSKKSQVQPISKEEINSLEQEINALKNQRTK